jgi:hypothetical protein
MHRIFPGSGKCLENPLPFLEEINELVTEGFPDSKSDSFTV